MSIYDSSFEYDALPGRVIFGAGRSRSALRGELEALGAARVLVVSSVEESPLAAELSAPWDDLVVGRFDGVRPHVPDAVAPAAVAQAEELGADVLVSIGGGSTTGTAKATALETGLPIVAVPTTYAGSEMTPVWGMTTAGVKTTGRSPRVLPRTVVYDPDLTHTLPAEVTAASGMNAIAHCVEALYAPGVNPVTSALAIEGIRAVAESVPVAVRSPQDPGARSGALLGAYLSGAAFAVAGSHLHHKICHALGGAFDLPHAHTHSVVLPYVADFFEPALGAEMARVSQALGGTSAGGVGRHIQEFASGLGLPLSLEDLGLPPGRVLDVVDPVLALLPERTPRPMARTQLVHLLEMAASGQPL